MSDSAAENPATPTPEDSAKTVERIADDIRDDVRLGHVQDDVSHVLEERLDEAGIEMRPEDVDDLAEEIEKDASS
ncbi:hypothetical protein [Arthrobacter rhizosphaerae]|uniref:hypothetical protein n=1 Tax=Arthrobacter rhizosphaerae TaxID=2855490 RepID=UPI001FF6C001|nr:hypothetical protein [Arthrobacter rhizosphaerae]